MDKWPDDHMLEAAWGIIANAYDGDWSKGEASGWREAAERWRDAYHAQLPPTYSGVDPRVLGGPESGSGDTGGGDADG